MKKLAIVLLLAGCGPQSSNYTETVCDPVTAPLRADFIVKCAEAANPKSDEEGEDLVRECGNQAEKLFCREERAFTIEGVSYPCSEAKTPLEMEACHR